MKTDKFKKNKYTIMALVLFPIMVIGSLLVKFNTMDAYYLILLIVFIVCYMRSE